MALKQNEWYILNLTKRDPPESPLFDFEEHLAFFSWVENLVGELLVEVTNNKKENAGKERPNKRKA